MSTFETALKFAIAIYDLQLPHLLHSKSAPGIIVVGYHGTDILCLMV